ncbi:MAG: class I SAM-dependent methyltransferase [Thermotogota bacterium]
MVKPEKMRDFFKARVDGYDEHMQLNVDDFEQIYTIVANPLEQAQKPVNLLDLGCGTGLELEAVFQKAPNAFVTGIDLSQEMLDCLVKKYTAKKEQITLILGSYLEIPFPEKEYDYALSVMTLHHLTKAEKVIVYQKIFNTLKDKGSYIEADYVVKSSEEADRLDRYHKIKEAHAIKDMYNYHVDIPFSKQTQIQLFKQAGFEYIEVVLELENACIFKCQKSHHLGGKNVRKT